MKVKRYVWISLTLLLVCYAWFGWYLSDLRLQPVWFKSACYRVFGSPISTQSEAFPYSELQLSDESHAEHQPTTTLEHTLEKASSPEAEPHSTTKHPPTESTEAPGFTQAICGAMVRHNLPIGLLAVAWIVLSSRALMSPLTGFSAFISHWFTSDTIAFTTLFLLAAFAAVVLFWLNVFLQILTILAVDMLARIDMQCVGLSGVHAFWILTLVSLTGLTLGWLANALI